MKSTILLLALATAALSSCTTAYKTGQTPDDVYFSPAPPQEEYVQVNKNDDRSYRNDEDYYDDRYLRMKVQNRAQWSELDDWYYYDNRYNYNVFNNWNNPWSPNAYWNYYYNPYCNSCCLTGGIKGNIAIGKPRTFNLNTYNSASLTNRNYSNLKFHGAPNSYNSPRVNTSTGANHNTGNFLRNIFNGNNNNSSSSERSSNSSRSSSSSSGSSGSSSGSSSSGSSAPVRRF